MRWELCEAQAVTEEAVTRTLALRRLARSLLETRKWISMFVPPIPGTSTHHTSPSVLLHQENARQLGPIPGSRLTGQAFWSRSLQRHSYASTSAPFNQNSDSTSANRTNPSPRRNKTVSAACFLGVFRLPNLASHRLSAALVSLTCRCTAHSISSSRSGVANSGELRMRVVMRAEIGWDGRLIESPVSGGVRNKGNDYKIGDVNADLRVSTRLPKGSHTCITFCLPALVSSRPTEFGAASKVVV
jgi:hypothetical protein